jgi:hypothetical protein
VTEQLGPHTKICPITYINYKKKAYKGPSLLRLAPPYQNELDPPTYIAGEGKKVKKMVTSHNKQSHHSIHTTKSQELH